MAVHLAARLLATQMDRQNRHAAAALRKLGHAIGRWAQRISQHVLQAADITDDSAQRDDPVYLSVLATLTEAWASERKEKSGIRAIAARRYRNTCSVHTSSNRTRLVKPRTSLA